MSLIASNLYLKKAITTGKLIPLIGAGVSMSIKNKDGDGVFPSWVELLKRAAQQLEPDATQLVNRLVDAGLLLKAAETAKKHLKGNRWFDFLASQFDPDLDELAPSKFELPRVLWQLSNRFITLNYDRVLEHSSNASNTKIITNSSDDNLSTFLLPTDKKMIWHLHGHIDRPKELILTLDSYKDFYEKETKYPAAMQILKSILATQNILFVGCSLKDAELLAELSKQFDLFSGNSAVHFALVHQNDEPLIKAMLDDIKNIEILTFPDFGQPLVDTIKEIALLKAETTLPENCAAFEPKSTIESKPTIAYLSAKPFGQILGDFTTVEKELKKNPPYDIESLPLSLANLQSLSEFNYLVLACHIKNDKLIIENEWCGSERIPLNELEDNIALDELKGIVIVCDQLPSQEALNDITLPIIFIP